MTDHDFENRRAAMEELADAVRALADAAAETAVDPTVVQDVTAAVREATARLAAATHDDPYSGLVRRPVNDSVPQNMMPLNPCIGDCNPSRPDVHLAYVDGDVRGTARLTRRFSGPPGYAHGGITALLADQIVSITPKPAGLPSSITKSLEIRFRRPVPLDTDLTLWGRCRAVDTDGDDLEARFTISVGDVVAAEGSAVLAPVTRFLERA